MAEQKKIMHQEASGSMPTHETVSDCKADEIDLADLVAVLWRRRWTIFFCTFMFACVGVLYAYLSTPKYAVTAQLRPGITGYTGKGEPKYDLKPQDIKTWFDKKAYIDQIRRNTFIKNGQEIRIKASLSRNSSVVSAVLLWPDPEKGKEILLSVLRSLTHAGSESLKRSLTVSQAEINKQIADKQSKIQRLELKKKRYDEKIEKERRSIQVVKADIELTNQKKEQIKHLVESIKGQIGTINKNTQELIKLRNGLLRVKGEQLSLLMYSNIIQQNINYVTVLWQRLTDLKNQMESLEFEKVSKEAKIKDIQQNIKELELQRDKELPLKLAEYQQEIEALKTKLDALSPVELVQHPYSSLNPVKPAKVKIVALSMVSGFFISIFCAFLRDFWVRNREKIANPKAA